MPNAQPIGGTYAMVKAKCEVPQKNLKYLHDLYFSLSVVLFQFKRSRVLFFLSNVITKAHFKYFIMEHLFFQIIHLLFTPSISN